MLMALNSLATVKKIWQLKHKTNNSISKLQRNTSGRSNKIQKKKRNDSPHLLWCILHNRTSGKKQSRNIFYNRTKIKNINTRDSPGEWIIVCRMQHNDECNGISHGSRIRGFVQKLTESDIHEDRPSRDGPPIITNTVGDGQHRRKQNFLWDF